MIAKHIIAKSCKHLSHKMYQKTTDLITTISENGGRNIQSTIKH